VQSGSSFLLAFSMIESWGKTPAGPKATDAEADELYRTMIAYSGSYSIEGNKVAYKIEVSWNQAWVLTRTRTSTFAFRG
jgi:hypothetical protein